MKAKLFIIIIFVIVCVISIFVYLNIFAKGSFEYSSNFTKSKELKSDEGRTNILIVGIDTRDKKYVQTGTLTDSMIVASIDFEKKDVKLLSMPRDFWVDKSGYGMKLNEVYTLKSFDDLKSTIEEILGIKIHYSAQVNFSAFEKIIDTVGGIDIDNPSAFTDYYYPKFGFEQETCGIDVEKLKKEKDEKGETISEQDFPCRYETVSFKQGLITLNGEEALKFARSRHSGDSGQGSDFARAKRQHMVIVGIKNKLLSTSTVANPSKIKDLFFLISDMVKSDIGGDELLIILPKASSFTDFIIKSEVISDAEKFEEGGVVTRGNPDLYGGRYVLIPKTNDSIKSFITTYFYGELKQIPSINPNE